MHFGKVFGKQQQQQQEGEVKPEKSNSSNRISIINTKNANKKLCPNGTCWDDHFLLRMHCQECLSCDGSIVDDDARLTDSYFAFVFRSQCVHHLLCLFNARELDTNISIRLHFSFLWFTCLLACCYLNFRVAAVAAAVFMRRIHCPLNKYISCYFVNILMVFQFTFSSLLQLKQILYVVTCWSIDVCLWASSLQQQQQQQQQQDMQAAIIFGHLFIKSTTKCNKLNQSSFLCTSKASLLLYDFGLSLTTPNTHKSSIVNGQWNLCFDRCFIFFVACQFWHYIQREMLMMLMMISEGIFVVFRVLY